MTRGEWLKSLKVGDSVLLVGFGAPFIHDDHAVMEPEIISSEGDVVAISSKWIDVLHHGSGEVVRMYADRGAVAHLSWLSVILPTASGPQINDWYERMNARSAERRKQAEQTQMLEENIGAKVCETIGGAA